VTLQFYNKDLKHTPCGSHDHFDLLPNTQPAQSSVSPPGRPFLQEPFDDSVEVSQEIYDQLLAVKIPGNVPFPA